MKQFSLTLALYLCAFAQSENFYSGGYANSAAEYLALPANASTAGMSGAVVASRDNLAHVQFNPAILDILPADSVYVGGTISILDNDMKHNAVSVAANAGAYCVLGLSYVNFGVSKLEGRNDFGALTRPFDYGANVFTASAAGRFAGGVALGASLTYFNEQLADGSANGGGIDCGGSWAPLSWLSIGACAQNLGAYSWWNTGTRDQVLPTGRVGVCGMFLNKTLVIETDFIKTQKQPEEIAGGVQYFFLDMFHVRFGMLTAVDMETQSSKMPDYSFGLGMRYDFIGFDYALLLPHSRQTNDGLGNPPHKISVCARFENF